jgi:hypothetical protein
MITLVPGQDLTELPKTDEAVLVRVKVRKGLLYGSDLKKNFLHWMKKIG